MLEIPRSMLSKFEYFQNPDWKKRSVRRVGVFCTFWKQRWKMTQKPEFPKLGGQLWNFFFQSLNAFFFQFGFWKYPHFDSVERDFSNIHFQSPLKITYFGFWKWILETIESSLSHIFPILPQIFFKPPVSSLTWVSRPLILINCYLPYVITFVPTIVVRTCRPWPAYP